MPFKENGVKTLSNGGTPHTVNGFKDSNTIVNGFSKAVSIKPAKKEWNIRGTKFAKNTVNAIRSFVETLKIQPNPEKPMIPLSIGDPTTFGNLKAADEIMNAVRNALENPSCNGYAHSQGHEEARRAIAKYSAHQSPGEEIDTKKIIICSGCSSALEYCLLALAEPGQNVLLPRPGFSVYKTHAASMNIEVRYYNLLPERNWEADLVQMESIIDDKTAAVLINNPNNPCGSVFSKKHLQNIINICERHCLPIIADEIYEHLVFPGAEFHSVSSLSRNVPVLTCSGLTKRFLVPGWRMGWIIVHDRENRLAEVFECLQNLCGRILGANTLIQKALPEILEKTPTSFYKETIDIIFTNAKLVYKRLSQVPGLKPIMPQGAMYIMVGIDMKKFPEFVDDKSFVQEMINEQSVFCLPGSIFEWPDFFRIVVTIPEDMIEEATYRIGEFCRHHYRDDNNLIENGFLKA